MTGYTKLFNSIIGSTIWQEKPATKVVWITMLTMKDKGGVVEASVPGLAKLSGVSIEEAEVALTKFLSPDPYSSSSENEGRRVERVDGGWRILNHYKYQEKMSRDDIKERDRIRQRQYREHKKCHTEGVTKCDTRDMSHQSRHIDVDVPPPEEENPIPSAHPSDEPEVDSSEGPSENGNLPHAKFIDEIWHFYLAESGMSPVRTQFTRERRQRIQRWFDYFLKNNPDTHGLSEKAAARVMAVIQGTCRDPYVSQNKSWLTIESILANQSKIDKGLARYEQQERQKA